MSRPYAFRDIERKWQDRWERERTFRSANPGQPGGDKPKYYVLDFFPYPSGAGLHVGHPLGYIATDIVARHKRMTGYNVLHPMGWDAFGLPAEQYAVEHGIHPRITTDKNCETFRRQLKMIGLSYDWDREIATCHEKYYRWTQWIFLKIYNSWYDPEHRWTDRDGRAVVGAARPIETLPIPAEVRSAGDAAIEEYRADHRLAYLAEVPVNWCPALGTVLSNEEITNDGRSERGNHPVYRRPMRQWMLRITEYADRLLRDLDELDWPEPVKLMQRNWIGRSHGAYVDFPLEREHQGQVIRIFTTRPDTLFGATYMVLAPEHRLVPIITTDDRRAAVRAYVEQAKQRSELERTADSKKKTGVFTGAYAINPVNRRRIPIWVADYVLMGYGTGSIMSVPGSDKRDLEFAETFGLDVVQVVRPPTGDDWRGFEDDGFACNSPPESHEPFTGMCELNGLPTQEAKTKIIAWLERNEVGEGTVQYKLRDWLFSRQRYWGEPFPILHAPDGRIDTVPEGALPVTLPPMDDFRPHASDDPKAEPQTPLSRAADWARVTRDGVSYRRELNTMPQWAGSCWYYLRFCDPHNDAEMIGKEAERYWMGGTKRGGKPAAGGVDLYLGGAEHAVLHLLYARFWHKVLYDLGAVSTPEPFQRLFNQGMIRSFAYRDGRGVCQPYEAIDFREDGAYLRATGEKLTASVEKMSKTLKNVVTPDAINEEYGSDTLRLYEMYMGPLEASKPWNTRDIVGVHRFLHRVWRLIVDEESGAMSARVAAAANAALEPSLHKTIKKVSADIESLSFNTAIAAMIEFLNEAYKAETIGREQAERFVLLLSPFAPHICEELWALLGRRESLAWTAWPTFDEAMTREETVEIAVQLNGKIKTRIRIAVDSTEEQVRAAALEALTREIGGKAPQKCIVVPRRLVNVIV